MLASLAPLILERQGGDRLAGVRAPVAFDGTPDLADQVLTMGATRLTARLIDPWVPRAQQHPETHGATVIQLAADDFVIARRGTTRTEHSSVRRQCVGKVRSLSAP